MLSSATLPIHGALPALRAVLAAGRSAVLQAPPGAGKSTVAPLALLEEPWARGRRILMLEPRRLAARAVARRMAATLGEEVGRTVGYRMRLDTRVSSATRVEVVTEGVLTRLLQSDPALDGVALVIFDEFHERSLEADLGLALVLDARDALAPDLRLLLMSATLEAEPAARLLGDAAVIRAAGRQFPVTTRYVGKGMPVLSGAGKAGGESAEQIAARAVRGALREADGDVLVFLPGAREIRRVRALLEADGAPEVRVLPLFGDLDAAAQEAALMPSPPGTRKVVLATNIAETSLTIEGVRVVVDSGLERHAAFDPGSGMSRLETRRISRASAEQRQGRAGRTAPGVCVRCWSEGAHAGLAAVTPPAIASADLAPLALELKEWGADAPALRWLDPPPAAMLASADDLLYRLGALDRAGRITPHGRQMAALAVHPRLAHMLLRGRELGCTRLAAELAALLSDRDLLARGGAERDPDVRTRLMLLRGDGATPHADEGTRRRARTFAARLAARLGRSARGHMDDADAIGLLLAFAYPDRIGRRRPSGDGRYTLANGRGAAFSEPTVLAREELIVALDLDDRDRDARILLAAPLRRAAFEEHFAGDLVQAEEVLWSSREEAVIARRTRRYGAFVIDEKPLQPVPAATAAAAMLDGVRELGLAALPWSDEARRLQARVAFVRSLGDAEAAALPPLDDASLAESLERWLAPWLAGITRRQHLAGVPLAAALRAQLSPEQLRRLDQLAPVHVTVPSGSRIPIDYGGGRGPSVAVRLQEVFGLLETPRIGGGRVPLTFELLSPARRPVQTTRDLASFWRSGYAAVRKDLRGRYPKHYWPENPAEAEPTREVRPRGSGTPRDR